MDQTSPHLKCEKPIGSKDIASHKRKGKNHESNLLNSELVAPEKVKKKI